MSKKTNKTLETSGDFLLFNPLSRPDMTNDIVDAIANILDTKKGITYKIEPTPDNDYEFQYIRGEDVAGNVFEIKYFPRKTLSQKTKWFIKFKGDGDAYAFYYKPETGPLHKDIFTKIKTIVKSKYMFDEISKTYQPRFSTKNIKKASVEKEHKVLFPKLKKVATAIKSGFVWFISGPEKSR